MKTCSVQGCDREVSGKSARGLCHLHYARLLRTGSVMADKPPQSKKPSGRECKVRGCVTRVAAWDMCQKHYLRAKNYGDPHGSHPKHRVRLKWIDAHAGYDGDDCLKWPFAVNSNGRGSVSLDGKSMPASRYMCMLAHGNPPTKRHHAAHTCGKGHEGCMNPRHLAWKTPKQNEFDKIKHGTIRRGTDINTSKLSESDVRGIRQMLSQGEKGVYIARKYGVSPTMVSNINRGRAWRWLD